VKVNITNGVSSLRVPVTVIQVGDNVTLVDVAVADWLVPVTSFRAGVNDWLVRMTSTVVLDADWLVPVNAAVNLTMDVPRGWPVIMTVDMGDGQPPQRITRPPDYM